MQGDARGAQLALISKEEIGREPERAPVPRVRFCSHCGAKPNDAEPQVSDSSRVCDSCSLGLMLETSADLAPKEGGAFLVIDSSLSICAVSGEAERLLATREPDAVNRHVTELLVPADAEAQGPANLAVAVTWAARGDNAQHQVTVRPTNVFGVRLRARIASCGSPQAALLVFDA